MYLVAKKFSKDIYQAEITMSNHSARGALGIVELEQEDPVTTR